jgi:DNA-binding transcriptional ArsR family regulator
MNLPTHTHWSIGPSISEELDFALYAVLGRFKPGELPTEYGNLVLAVPESWRAELVALLGSPSGSHGVIGEAAYLAGVVIGDDYSQVTLAIRELTIETALERLSQPAAEMGIAADPSLPPEARLIDLFLRVDQRLLADAGYDLIADDLLARRREEDYRISVRLLSGGDLHARFWHWLDRFYYELYHPWRATQAARLEEMARHAQVALGSSTGAGIPDLTWLPALNPLVVRPSFAASLGKKPIEIYFWVEPFGIADSFSLYPGLILVSFATPGAIYENFMAFVGDVATRTAALADPTRLIILRLIRQFGMINTEIAAYLGLARPTVSIHARILREAGLIRSKPEGRLMRHEMVPSEVRRLFTDLQRVLDLPEEEEVPKPKTEEEDLTQMNADKNR